jgi:hypothetical protein
MIPGKSYTPEDVLRAVSRRKWIIIVPFILTALGAAYYAYSLPNRYRSETLILVVPQRIPETYVRSTVTSRIEDRLRSIREQVLSRSRLEPIIRDFGLYLDMREKFPMEEVVAAMRSQVTIACHRASGVAVYRREPARPRGPGNGHERVSREAARERAAEASRTRKTTRGVPPPVCGRASFSASGQPGNGGEPAPAASDDE